MHSRGQLHRLVNSRTCQSRSVSDRAPRSTTAPPRGSTSSTTSIHALTTDHRTVLVARSSSRSMPRMTSPALDNGRCERIDLGSRRWAGLAFAVSVRRVSRGVFDPFIGDVNRCPTGAVDVRRSRVLRGITRTVTGRLRASSPRSSSAAVRPRRSMSHGGRRCSSIACAARHHSDRHRTSACELPRDHHQTQSDHGARCPTGAVDVRRSHVLRGPATRTVDRPQYERAATCGSSMFAVSVRRVSRAALDTFIGRDVQDISVRAPPRSSSAAVRPRRSMSPRGSLTFDRRCCAASLGPSLDRSTASQ